MGLLNDLQHTVILKLIITFFTPLLVFTGCSHDDVRSYSGYVEAEYVNISSSQSGKLDKLYVKRGSDVIKGSRLFTLDAQSELIALEQASSELSAAEATLRDFKKGARNEEVKVIEAQLSQAIANAENTKKHLERNTLLLSSDSVSKAQYDESVTMARTAAAKVSELRNALKVAKLSKRSDQISAQESRIQQLKSAVRQAQWRVDEKTINSPIDAFVFDTFYRQGEWVSIGNGVVRLLPAENVKIRFFVPQQIAETLMIGDPITIASRAKGKAISAVISYISPEAEYTPPVIYSNETNEKLVFMVEAYPKSVDDARLLHPGQPVEITLGK